MSTEKVEMIKYTCDGCGREFFEDPVESIGPDGYHGTVSEVSNRGGITAKWFACRETCIRKAVAVSLDRAYD